METIYIFILGQPIENTKESIYKMIKENYSALQNQTGLITVAYVQGLRIQETIGKSE